MILKSLSMESSNNPQTALLEARLSQLASVFWPELKTMSEARRLVGLGDIFSLLYTLPLALVGLIWLTSVSNLKLFSSELPILMLVFGLIALFSQVNYFIIIEIRTDRY